MPKKQKKRKLSLTTILVTAIVVIFLLILIFTSPLFQIKVLNFEGGLKYSKEEILSELKLNIGTNIFMVRPNHIKKYLEAKPYVKSVTISLSFPSELTIKIKERKVRGYVSYIEGTYLYIDEDGRVLESNKTYKEQLPLVEGLDFDRFKLGEILEVKNPKSFEIVVKTAGLLAKYEAEYEAVGDILKIDVSDPDNIHIYIKNVDVLLGDLTEYDFKIRKMLTILKDIADDDKGFLDITNPEKGSIFEHLT